MWYYCSIDDTAPIPKDEGVYVQQPLGFVKNPNLVLKFNSCLYGMKQSPRYFFGHLMKKLQGQGLVLSKHDPWPFLGNSLLVITYVDTILIYGWSQAEIDDLIAHLKEDNLSLHKEGIVEGYLGLKITRDGNKTILPKPGLIKRGS